MSDYFTFDAMADGSCASHRERHCLTCQMGAEVVALREMVLELARCLSYARCDSCGLYYGAMLGPCILADHVEAFEALRTSRGSTR